MEQLERLFSALSPAAIGLVCEQVETYRSDPVASSGDGQDVAWCDRVLEVGRRSIADKSV